MRHGVIVWILFTFITGVAFSQQLENESVVQNIYLADPTIFEEKGTFYLYGTKSDPRIEGDGFLVYTSTDLKNWNGPIGAKDGFALKKGEAFGTKGFWAPQIFKYNGLYYMAYTADENIAVATSKSPLGPFQNNMKALDAPVRQIDPFVFFDEGKIYLYHVRLQEGNRIFVAEMTEDLRAIKPETLKEVINAESGWEDTQKVEWPVAEGPTVLKRNNLYYLLYSANDFRNPDYAVGYATSNSPLGPWEKDKESPIIHKDLISENGSGHGDVFYNKSGQMFYVLHTHFSEEEVHPRKTGIIEINYLVEEKENNLEVQNETFTFLKMDANN